MKDPTFHDACTAEEVRAPGTVAGETLGRGSRGERNVLDMLASDQAEVTRPSQRTGGFVLLTGSSDQRFHESQPTVRRLTTILGTQPPSAT
jgi:hypothetical protein